MEKTITTSCSFPLIKLNVNIKYAEVRKPTGVGYIILVLIKDSKDRKESLKTILKRFGVPDDLQFIFADEVDVLLNREILKLADNQFTYDIEDPIGHLFFTQNGERMFSEGAIPTGNEKSRQKDIFLNPLTGEFSFNAASAQPIERAEYYPKDFMSCVDRDTSGLKEFLIDNSREAGLQKEERVTDCEIKDETYLISRSENNLDLCIDEDGMDIGFRTNGAEEFYKKYFTPDMVERILTDKMKFKSDVSAVYVTGFGDFNSLSTVHPPEEYSKYVSFPSNILLTRNGGKIDVRSGKNSAVFENRRIAAAVSETHPGLWSFTTLNKGEMKVITAANVDLTERVLGKPVGINLLVEQLFGENESVKVLKAILDECKEAEYSDEKAHLIKAINRSIGGTSSVSDYIIAKISSVTLGGDGAKQAKVLLSANSIFKDIQGWQAIAEKEASEIYNRLIADMNRDNIGYNVSAAKTLDTIREPGKDELLHVIAGKFGDLSEVTLFNILTSAKFTDIEALSVANIVKIYVSKILADETELEKSSISDNFTALAGNLKDLKDNIGIRSTTKYAFREGYNVEKFITDFKAFRDRLKSVKKHEVFAKEGFAELSKYEEIMLPAFEYIMIERNASSNPEKINESYIRSKINAGEYRVAIGDMSIRLEYMLSKILGLGKGIDVIEKIDRAKQKNILTEDEGNTLHELRKFRNSIQHPTEEKLNYDIKKMSLWADAVFTIKDSPGWGK